MRVVVTGASGQIGAYLLESLQETGWDVVPWSGGTQGLWGGTPLVPVDLADQRAIEGELARADPHVVLHLAAISAADQVRREPARGRIVNVDATRHLAQWCQDHGRRIVFSSTDMVFDGDRSWYSEADEPRPILAYGETKQAAEAEVLRAPDSVVARVCLLFGPTRCGRETFFDRAVEALREGRPQTFFDDEYRTPLGYRTIAEVLVELVRSDYRGIVHVGGRERLSRFDFMNRIARELGLDTSLVRANSRTDAVFAEPRPADLSLDTSLLSELFPDLERPKIEESIRGMLSESGD